MYLRVLTVFILLAALPTAAHAAPATPRFGPSIEGYATYDGQNTCDPAPKPGVLAFKDLLHRAYGVHTWGITRSCATPGVSEHEEGRALDYHFNLYDNAQRADAEDVLTWLLATDEHGNAHAAARRLGLMYIIWNRQIWESYRPHAGWQVYHGSNPHIDHIHFSFSRVGALGQTSWWLGGAAPVEQPTAHLADFDGDGKPDLASISGDTLTIGRNVSDPGTPAKEPGQVVGAGWAAVRQMATVDFDGDGRADILGNIGADLMLWLSTGATGGASMGDRGQPESSPGISFAAPVRIGPATAHHLTPADFDGDGRVDLAGFVDGALIVTINKGLSTLDSRPPIPGFANVSQLTTVDWDGDNLADLLGREGDELRIWLGAGASFAAPISLGVEDPSIIRYLVPADFDGDGRPDLAARDLDGTTLFVARNTSVPGAPSRAPATQVIGGWYSMRLMLTADFDGDGKADLLGRTGELMQLWRSVSTADEWFFEGYRVITGAHRFLRIPQGSDGRARG